MTVSGSAFFESEETTKVFKSLYKEAPMLTVYLHESGQSQPIKSMPLPVSHLFEFKDVPRGKPYDIVVKSGKPMVDRRHETQATVTLEAGQTNDDSFTKIIVPIKGRAVPTTA